MASYPCCMRKINIIFTLIVCITLSLITFHLQAQEARLSVSLHTKSSWAVSPYIFGRFFELNGRDAYPGFISQHLANSSFEPWSSLKNNHLRDEIIFKDVQKKDNIAYPWEFNSSSRAWFKLVPGGKHGEYFQRIIHSAEGKPVSFFQKTVLPDKRTLTYNITFFARSVGDELPLQLALTDADQLTLADSTIQLSGEWRKYQASLTLEQPTASRYQESPFGIYQLEFNLPTKGIVDIDHVMLSAGDALMGKFNPTTAQWMQDFNVSTLRWPGGNYASMYRWKDAVGPIDERPVSTNDEWGGLEPNYFGTNEFLEFCRLTGVEPYINVPFNLDVAAPEYVAQWVEYVNGGSTSPMGKLRTQHGYPEPWNVKYWQVGNEHYGKYQAGYVFKDTYTEGIKDYISTMKEADPDIKIFAAGADPLYADVGGDEWNEALLDKAGKKIDGIDIHRYVNYNTISREELDRLDPLFKGQLFTAFPSQYERILENLIQDAAKRGFDELMINIGEWNLSKVQVSEDEIVDYPTMPHAAFVAGMYNVFIRQGKWVKFSHQRDNTLWFRPYHNDFRPVNPGAYVLQMYAEPFVSGEKFFKLDVKTKKGPTFSHQNLGKRMLAMEEVPFIDVAAVVNEKEDRLLVFLTNRNLKEEYELELQLPGRKGSVNQIDMKEIFADPVFTQQISWEENQFHIREDQLQPSPGNTLRLKVKASAVVRLEMRMNKGS
jgi:alpha-N-arabinofuranosidase